MLDNLAQIYGKRKFNDAPTLELWAHNMTYDGSFLLKHLLNIQILEKDNKYVSMKGAYCYWKKKRKISKEVHKKC